MAGMVAKGSGTKRLVPKLVGGCAAQRIGMHMDKAVPECMQCCRRGELLNCPASNQGPRRAHWDDASAKRKHGDTLCGQE